MRKIEKTLFIYEAQDGTEFTSKENCLNYEHELNGLKFFKVYHTVDKTETGNFINWDYYAVFSNCGLHKEILEQYLVFEKQFLIIDTGVQGYGLSKGFEICEKQVNWQDDLEKNKIIKNATILSPKQLTYFFNDSSKYTYFNYAKSWNLKISS